ncbi:methyltransferase domain-containing protein [Uliginosibacterium paludis]|uniref:Methyltransferase domain-containing protein n=1 Tax=Uliginosibacterium paludis TaxID=1615952 RepID=A0ABV2CMQ5_9RHOO
MNWIRSAVIKSFNGLRSVRRIFGLPALADQALAQLRDAQILLRIVEERSRSLERQADAALELVRVVEERSRIIESQLNDVRTISATAAQQASAIEIGMNTINAERCQISDSLLHVKSVSTVLDQRTQSLMHQSTLQQVSIDFVIDSLHKTYVESLKRGSIVSLDISKSVLVETDYPVAVQSNDHLYPESTAEGVVRPTPFVLNSIEILGKNFRFLDLGVGGGGLVYEMAVHGVMAVGVDGSDFCRRNEIGFWPLLPGRLHTCDITKPFCIKSAEASVEIRFDLISSWEVLEHIAEVDLPGVLANVRNLLAPGGYFVGSISCVEYLSRDGVPYHVTVKSRDWWRALFWANGLAFLDDPLFRYDSFPRGNGWKFQDFHNYANNPSEGFHFVSRLCVS